MDKLEQDGLQARWPRILALLTCLVMTLVVAEQGLTIEKQRELIQLLWGDSKQLTQIRIQDLAKQHPKMYVTEPKEPKEEKRKAEKAAPAPQRPSVPSVLPAKPARLLKQI
jgi:hypothetical protein